MIRKYIIEIILFALLVILALTLVISRLPNRQLNESNNSYLEPSIAPARDSMNYTIKINFSDPSALYKKVLSLKVICQGGENDLGSFIVKDTRLWRADDTRIINNEFKVTTKPEYLVISESSNGNNKNLFEGEIASNTTLASLDDSIVSNIQILVTYNQ